MKSLHDQLDLLCFLSLSLPSLRSLSVRPDLLSLYISLERVPKKINLICPNEILIVGTRRGRRLTALERKHSSLFLSAPFPRLNFSFTFIPQALRLRFKGGGGGKNPLAATYYTAKSTGTKIDKLMHEQSEAGLGYDLLLPR